MDHDTARAAIATALAGIAPEVDLASCDPTQPFAEEADLDSMDLLSLVTALAQSVGVDLSDTASPRWTLDEFVDHLVAGGG